MISNNVADAGQAVTISSIDWTLIVLSLAVMVSLIIGIVNIILTKNIEARRYKYEVFKEICDWLESVMRCGAEVNLKFMELPKVTSSSEKAIAEEAIAQYYRIASRINFISNVSALAGIPSSSFKIVENGILDVMNAIDGQLDSKQYNIASLFTGHVRPLNEACSDLMGQIGLALGEEVKLKPSKTLTSKKSK